MRLYKYGKTVVYSLNSIIYLYTRIMFSAPEYKIYYCIFIIVVQRALQRYNSTRS